MAIRQYDESGMCFSFEEENVILPEKEDWYTRWQGVKMVDFIWKRSSTNLVVVEAKTSSPNFKVSANADQGEYIQELFEKFNAALHATVGLTLNTENYSNYAKHPKINTFESVSNKINLVLIIQTAQEAWLPITCDALQRSPLFQNLLKTTGSQIIVLNPELANRQFGAKFIS